jgi:hypothetical protein
MLASMSDRLPRLSSYVTAQHLATKPRRADWLISTVMERGTLGLLFGDPGAGKSFLALSWSCAIATGLNWLGKPVQRGSVIYIAGEGFGGIGRRVKAWCVHHGASMDMVPLYVSEYGENFSDAEQMADFTDNLKRAPQPIGLIVVDTLARATPGLNEDRASEMGAFVNVCDNLRMEFGCAVLVLHHSPHSDKGRAKGSIALKGAVDFEFGLMRTSEEGVVRLTCTKMKDGEPPPDTFLRFLPVDIGDGQTSAVLVECDPPSPRSGKGRKITLTANDKLFLMTLGSEPADEAAVRTAFLQRHPSGNRDSAAKGYLRARRRGLDRQWFIEDGKTLIPSAAAIMRDRPDGQDGQQDSE